VATSGSRTVGVGEREHEPITLEIVVPTKEKIPMTIENDALCADLRAWMKSPAIGLPEYAADPVVQRRIGRMLATFSPRVSSCKEVHPKQVKLVV
jgi:hypothetical protein